MARPQGTPIGLRLHTTARAVSRAFNDALAEAGGSLPLWLLLSALRGSPARTQLELAHAIGIEGPTLTRHLDGFEQAGLVRRVRDSADRRAVRVELTPAGERRQAELVKAVGAFHRRLTAGLDETELAQAADLLARLERNVRPPVD